LAGNVDLEHHHFPSSGGAFPFHARLDPATYIGGSRLIPDAQKAITAIRDLDDVSDSLIALDARLRSIAERTLALLRKGAQLAEIIESSPAS
jgi:hypothetical protein